MTVEEWTFASDAETLVQLQPTRKLLHIVLFKQELLQISKFSKKNKKNSAFFFSFNMQARKGKLSFAQETCT